MGLRSIGHGIWGEVVGVNQAIVIGHVVADIFGDGANVKILDTVLSES